MVSAVPKRRSLLAWIAALLAGMPVFAGRQPGVPVDRLRQARYEVEGDAFIRQGGDGYGNRPLYCDHTYAVALGGDKPYAVLGSGSFVLGDLLIGLSRGGRVTWLPHAASITSIYRPGVMAWTIGDPAWGATRLHLMLVPTAHGPGMALQLVVEAPQPADRIEWACGSALHENGPVLWVYDMISQAPRFLHRGFVPEDSQGERVALVSGGWTVQAAEPNAPVAHGACSLPGSIGVADSRDLAGAAEAGALAGSGGPMIRGSGKVPADGVISWVLGGPGVDTQSAPDAFQAGLEHQRQIEARIAIQTPDPLLDAAVHASNTAEEGCFREGIYTHSGMRWATPLLGWRTLFGATAYGWHDQVREDAETFLAHQITKSSFTKPRADPLAQLTSQAPDSRMFGVGRIDLDQPHHYDMQSQFFDQLAHAWRWTGDPELEKALRPALELHCDYIRDCFDPEGLGIYESYANTWPTDDQWYNGGGTSEETAYAYRAEITAQHLAERAGDAVSAQRHRAAAARIQEAFFRLLWSKQAGHPGAYREQGGLRRLHESAWLYSIFCPIDAGLLTAEQAAEALDYTQRSLERVPMPYGGEQCWPSNWVPSIWSVREMWAGDNYHLALAYFQTGLAEEGWSLLRGTFPQQLVYGPVPGDLGHPAGGTDFNDCNSMFGRAVVEGLFGYRPDYPAGRVVLAPQFPMAWEHASLKTPDFSLSFAEKAGVAVYDITLAHPAPLELRLPVWASEVSSVSVNGQPVPFQREPGFDRGEVHLALEATVGAHVELHLFGAKHAVPPVRVSAEVGAMLDLRGGDQPILAWHDPQGVLSGDRSVNGGISGRVNPVPGDHVLFGLVDQPGNRLWRRYLVHVTDSTADAAERARTRVTVPGDARWLPVDLTAALNGDVRTLFLQKYLSPRPDTCSLRLATDGYSTWQMVLGKSPKPAPTIGLEAASRWEDGKGEIRVGAGKVPFRWASRGPNIAFVSQWDNWPRRVEIPIHASGDALWLLLCGSTNPMQVRIANARILLHYADGATEAIDVVPPFNFWSLCPMGGVDYDYTRDGFSLPTVPPETVQLGQNCRAVLMPSRLRTGVVLNSVELVALSQEVVIGLMGATVMNPEHP